MNEKKKKPFVRFSDGFQMPKPILFGHNPVPTTPQAQKETKNMGYNSLNSAAFSGRVGNAPTFNQTPSGTELANFDLAVSRYNARVEGDNKNETMWVRITVFGRQAEFVDDKVKKGALVGVSGSLWVRQYVAKDGSKGFSTELVANEVQILHDVEEKPAARRSADPDMDEFEEDAREGEAQEKERRLDAQDRARHNGTTRQAARRR